MDHDTPQSQSTSESLAAASADAEPSPAWADELALAREALKERVQQQQAADGSIEIPHLPSPPSPPPPDELLQTEVHKEEGAVTAANAEQQDRRVSTASTGEAEGLHVEDEEEDWVHTHLTGLRRRRPEMAESASGAGGAASREGAEGASSAAAAEEEKTCRICFGGSEEVEELGKLFSPCQCRGTVRASPCCSEGGPH